MSRQQKCKRKRALETYLFMPQQDEGNSFSLLPDKSKAFKSSIIPNASARTQHAQ
jgi:hypothetical protein